MKYPIKWKLITMLPAAIPLAINLGAVFRLVPSTEGLGYSIFMVIGLSFYVGCIIYGWTSLEKKNDGDSLPSIPTATRSTIAYDNLLLFVMLSIGVFFGVLMLDPTKMRNVVGVVLALAGGSIIVLLNRQSAETVTEEKAPDLESTSPAGVPLSLGMRGKVLIIGQLVSIVALVTLYATTDFERYFSHWDFMGYVFFSACLGLLVWPVRGKRA